MSSRNARARVILAVGNTDSVVSDVFEVGIGDEVVVMVYPQSALGADSAELQIQDPAGTWMTMTSEAPGVTGDVDLSATFTTYKIPHAGVYRLSVGTRTGSWGAAVWTD